MTWVRSLSTVIVYMLGNKLHSLCQAIQLLTPSLTRNGAAFCQLIHVVLSILIGYHLFDYYCITCTYGQC